MAFVEPFVGTEGGPPSANAFKRAVYRQAPPEFSLEILPPQKQGSNFSYGMRIYPIRRENDLRSTRSSMTGGSSSSMSEYEIWRRWEDCLHFQDTLETLYTQMAREKRARLLAGKGVKKDGVYTHEDPLRRHHRAASFESLPPGPDPHMIAKDLHDVLPKLTKKGTLFRASAATVEQRQQEFTALIEALWQSDDEVPALIQELRQMRIVRDFFGFWRRDKDRLEKEIIASGKGRPDSINSSSPSSSKRNTSSSFSSMYFSASNLSLQLPSSAPVPPSPLSASAKAKGREDRVSVRTDRSSGHHRVRQRANTSQGLTLQSSASMDSASSTSSSSGSSNTHNRQPQQRRVTDPRPGPSRQPPASAPAAGVTFTFTLHSSSDEDGEGYLSEMVETPASDKSPITPRSAPPHAVSMAKLLEKELPGNIRRDLTNDQSSMREPHVVVHDSGLSAFDDEESELDMIAREHESFMQHTLDPLMESMELGDESGTESGGKEYEESIIDSSLQRTAIPEEEENDDDEDIDDIIANEIVISQSPIEEEAVPVIRPVARRRNVTIDARNCNRNAQVFLPGEDGRLSIMETLSTHNFSEAPDATPNANVNGKPRPSSTGSSGMVPSRVPSLKERRGSGSTIGTTSDESWYSLASNMLKRSLSTTSSKATHRLSQVSTLSVPEEVQDGDGFIDSYYYNHPPQENGDDTERVPTLMFSPSREFIRGGVSEPDQYPAPFRNRPAGQFHLPWSAARPKSPVPSTISTFSTATAATNVTTATIIGNPDDSLLVKAIFHDSIIAFRIDRTNTTLQDVRQKILDKFVAQQGVPLSNSFSMSYQKPRLVVQRPTGTTGRVRSNSLSSVGSTTVEGGYLRKITSQGEWMDALSVGGNKLTIQLSDSAKSM